VATYTLCIKHGLDDTTVGEYGGITSTDTGIIPGPLIDPFLNIGYLGGGQGSPGRRRHAISGIGIDNNFV
jgi:hypothetical protein